MELREIEMRCFEQRGQRAGSGAPIRQARSHVGRSILRAPIGFRLLVPAVLGALIASPAHAQRVPDEFVWFAGTSLLAPFAAIPIKLGILRLVHLEAGWARLWSISAIEWLIWFPVGFAVLRYGRSSSAPLMALSLFALIAWIHTKRLTNASWRHAVILSLPTPVTALLLPFLAFEIAVFIDSHFA